MLKDLVEQCRLLHVTLVGVCLALVLAATSDLTNVDATAYKEMSAVSVLASKWDDGWMIRSVRSEVPQRFDKMVADEFPRRRKFLVADQGHLKLLMNVDSPWYLTPDNSESVKSGLALRMRIP